MVVRDARNSENACLSSIGGRCDGIPGTRQQSFLLNFHPLLDGCGGTMRGFGRYGGKAEIFMRHSGFGYANSCNVSLEWRQTVFTSLPWPSLSVQKVCSTSAPPRTAAASVKSTCATWRLPCPRPRAIHALGPDAHRLPDVLQRVHPDERQRVCDTVLEALAAGAPVDIGYRIVRPTGEERHLCLRAESLRARWQRALRRHDRGHDPTSARTSA